MLKASGDVSRRFAIEFIAVVMATVLHDVVVGIFAEVVYEIWLVRNWNRGGARAIFCEQKSFSLTLRCEGVRGHVGDHCQVYGQVAVQEWAIRPFQTLNGRQRIRVVVAQDYVTHVFPRLSLRKAPSCAQQGR